MTGYDAFHSSAALLDRSSRGRILVTGEDRKRLLHALTTNQIEKLAPGQGVYVFFLNAQGRVLSDGIILCRSEDLLISVEPEASGKILAHIDRYVIADDVTLEDAGASTVELALEGPRAAEVLASTGAAVPDQPFSFTEWNGVLVTLASCTGSAGFRLIAELGLASELRRMLTTAGAVEATMDEAETVRLEYGTPRYGVDISESVIAQETGLAGALNFNKGCYLGQEIVERVRSRGHVNRVLTALSIAATTAPAAGAKVMQGGTEVGEITSAAYSPKLQVVRALAYVRTAALASGRALNVEGASAKSVQNV